MVYKSVVTSAGATSESLRTTIPIEISRQLNLKAGDVLDWLVVKQKDKRFMFVRKLE